MVVALLTLVGPSSALAQSEKPDLRDGKSQQLDGTSEQAVRLRYAFSCAAYAFIKTGEFPATVRVYQEGKEPRSPAEAEEAAEGLVWTNRVYFARGAASALWKRAHKEVPTNGDLSDGVAEWVELLLDSPKRSRMAIRTNCRKFYERADTFCNRNGCMRN